MLKWPHKFFFCRVFWNTRLNLLQMWEWWTPFYSVGSRHRQICCHEIWHTWAGDWPLQWIRSSTAFKHVKAEWILGHNLLILYLVFGYDLQTCKISPIEYWCFRTETEYVSQMLTKMKRFAQHHECHVWFVAHPKQVAYANMLLNACYVRKVSLGCLERPSGGGPTHVHWGWEFNFHSCCLHLSLGCDLQ